VEDLEICEKLKEGGFPQDGTEKSWKIYNIEFMKGKISPEDIKEILAYPPRLGYNFGHKAEIDYEVDICAAPNTQELLDYLGDRFGSLRHKHDDPAMDGGHLRGQWIAATDFYA